MDQSRPTVAAVAALTFLALLLNPAHRSGLGSGPIALATFQPPASAPAPASASAGALVPTGDTPALDQDPIKPIRDFFRTLGPDRKDIRQVDHSIMSSGADGLEQSKLEFLIATVPDPVDSRFGHRFDEAQDAIQSAIEAKQYVPDRYFLPWEPGKTEGAGGDGAQPPKTEKFVEHVGKFFAGSGGDPKWAQLPACVLYRGVGHPDHLLVLFLVGETPTWGIHKVAFSNSLRLAALLLEEWGAKASPGQSDVRIIGPYFSGSQSSLERAINHWIGDHPKSDPFGTFYVCTGSATGIDPREFERNASHDNDGKVVFWATVLPDQAVMSTLFGYISERTPSDEKIALLTESDTKFGASIQKTINQVSDPKKPLGDDSDQETRRLRELYQNITFLRFPLHISDIRSAYGADMSKDAGNQPRLVTPIGTIPIPFDDTNKPRDLIPAMSPRLTTATENLLIARILATISREAFRFVGIAATDTRDKIFLITLIREFCPDVQIFFSDNDLLLAYPQYSRFLRGSLVASTYPLFPPNREWSPPHRAVEQHQRMQFAYEGDQGYYNATVALLNDGYAQNLDRTAGILDDKYAQEYGMPFLGLVDEIRQSKGLVVQPRRIPAGARASDLPVWISVIGQNGAWPVEVRRPRLTSAADLERYELKSNYPPVGSTNPEHAKAGFRLICPDLPLTWCVFFAGYTFFCLFVCYITVTPPGEGLLQFAGTAPGGTWFVDLFHPRCADARREQELYILAYLAVMALSYAALAFPCFIEIAVTIAAGMQWRWEGAEIWFAPIVATATLACIALTAVKCPRRRPGSRYWDRSRIASFLVGVLVLVFLRAEVAFLDWDQQEGIWTRLCFSFQRMVTLVSGVSPTSPVVLLASAALLAVHFQLKRLLILENYQVDCPYPETEDGPFRSVVAAHKGIRAMFLKSGWKTLRRPVFCLVAIVAVVVLYEIAVRYIHSVEGRFFDAGVWLVFVFIPIGVLGALLRSLQLWSWIAELLNHLALLPMSGAYDRLPEKNLEVYGRYLANERLEEVRLSLPQQQLQAVTDYYQKHRDELSHFTWDPAVPLAPDAGKRPNWGPVLAACKAGLELVRRTWPARTACASFPHRALEGAGAEVLSTEAEWLRRVEDLVALTTVAYLNQYMVHLRNAFVFLTVTPLLLVAAAMSYPFQPHRLLVSCLWGLVAATALVSLTVSLRMERSELLSRISKTNTKGLTFDTKFVTMMLTYVLPLLGLVVAQFPEVSDLLNSVLEPVSRVVR